MYPKNYVAVLEKAASETTDAYKRGEITAFDNPEDLLAVLHDEVGNK